MCPEGRKIFQSVSVYENLLAGAYIVKDKREVQQNVEMVFEFFPRLGREKKTVSGNLVRWGAADAGCRKGIDV